jgi:hypothetical protein
MSEQRVQVVSVAPELRIDASVPLRIRFEAAGLIWNRTFGHSDLSVVRGFLNQMQRGLESGYQF